MRGLITMRESIDQHGQKISIIEHEYIDFFESINCQLVTLPNAESVVSSLIQYIEAVDFIVLSGGGDPQESSTVRYQVEIRLIEIAAVKKIPVIAICRGMQVYLNNIKQLPLSKITSTSMIRTPGVRHNINYESNIYEVNHYHEFQVKNRPNHESSILLGLDYETEAIEIYYSPDERFLGFQWHPERESELSESRNLAIGLIKEVLSGCNND